MKIHFTEASSSALFIILNCENTTTAPHRIVHQSKQGSSFLGEDNNRVQLTTTFPTSVSHPSSLLAHTNRYYEEQNKHIMKYSTVFGRIKLGCLAAALVVFGCGGFIFADSLPLDANQEAVGSPTMAPVMVVPSVVRAPEPTQAPVAPTDYPVEPSSPVVGDDDDDDDDSCASGDDDDDDGRRALVKKRAKRGRKTKKSCKKDTSPASF